MRRDHMRHSVGVRGTLDVDRYLRRAKHAMLISSTQNPFAMACELK